ncbi:MAG TPA: hypothetical protein VL463_10185 [Kofleriaceae bacterium]|jgi:hypothetical protein|nr:hypothetical protein [Kofleriaceae bacterium]
MRLAFAIFFLTVATAPALAADPTKDQALATLDAWVKAQNGGDFDAYGKLYDAKFSGIKRTNDGGAKKFTLAKWKADRKKMFKVTQKVAAEQVSVVIKNGKATLEFTQRYQAGGYADHGDKELVLAAGADGTLKIVREEMLYSAPGWNADPKAELDATALASPITVKVRQVAADPSMVGGDCASVSYTLELTDANKKKVTQDVGSGVVMIDKATVLIDADPTADKLFEFGAWCAGGADYYQIVKNGDGLTVRYKAEDEGSEDEPAPTPTWETRLSVKLPAGAKLK